MLKCFIFFEGSQDAFVLILLCCARGKWGVRGKGAWSSGGLLFWKEGQKQDGVFTYIRLGAHKRNAPFQMRCWGGGRPATIGTLKQWAFWCYELERNKIVWICIVCRAGFICRWLNGIFMRIRRIWEERHALVSPRLRHDMASFAELFSASPVLATVAASPARVWTLFYTPCNIEYEKKTKEKEHFPYEQRIVSSEPCITCIFEQYLSSSSYIKLWRRRKNLLK